MSTHNPYSPEFNYSEYSLEKLDEMLSDVLNCEETPPEDIYDTIIKCLDSNIEYHKTHFDRSTKVLSLLKGYRSVDFDESYDGWDYDAAGAKFPPVTEATKKDWADFWEESYYPEEYSKEQIRKFELKERDYETKRAQLDAQISRNDPDRISFQNGWVYESPDGGKTVTKRRPGSTEKYPVNYATYHGQSVGECPPGTICINGECCDLDA